MTDMQAMNAAGAAAVGIPHMEERAALGELHTERERIEGQRDAATSEGRAKRSKLYYEHAADRQADLAAADAEVNAAEAPFTEPLDAIEEKIEAVGIEPLYDEDLKVERCAKSGVVILEDDEFLEDPETYEKVLRCLVLPPRKDEFDEGEGE